MPERSSHTVAVWGCLFLSAFAAAAPQDVPVILISIDTARADHFSCYGYSRATTPFLEEWSRDAVVFDNAFTEATWTLPAHATLFTGLRPDRHGVNAGTNLAESFETLAERLKESGYATAALTGSSLWFYRWRNLCQGFDDYDIPKRYRDVFHTADLANTWLDIHPGPRAFLFFHIMDLHSRSEAMGAKWLYQPASDIWRHFSEELNAPKPFDFDKMRRTPVPDEVRTFVTARYDDCIRSVDSALRDLVGRLKREGRYDNALIIVASDHGEELGERGRFGHWTVYDECARIPMLVKFPQCRFAGQRYVGVVQLADVYPTVCETVGLPVPEKLDGVGLARFVEGRTPPRTFAHIQHDAQTAVRGLGWKYIAGGEKTQPEAYDLAEDPGEQHNRVSQVSSVLEPLIAEHKAWYTAPTHSPSAPPVLDAEQRELMDGLGYLNK